MSVNVNPNIANEGLVLSLDAANPRSYPGSGSTWIDVSGTDNNGELINSVLYENENNGILAFDGSDEYIQLPQTLENTLNGIPQASLIMWIKLNSGRNSSGNSGIVQLTSHTSSNGNLYFYTDSSRIGGIWLNVFRTDRVFTGDWQPSFDGASWHMLTVTTSPGSNGWKMYLNDTLRFQTTGQSVVSVDYSLFGGFRIGRNSSRSIRGRIGVTKIYNRALSITEVQQNFTAFRGRFGI